MNALVKSSQVSPARRAAFYVLQRVEDGAYASILLASEEEKLSPADRALCHELVMGVLRHQLWLDKCIEHFSNRWLDPAVRTVLRLGLYQLRFLSRIPASAAVNESVNLTIQARFKSARGLVNAVLRRATREREYDPTNDVQDPIERLAIATSHPVWLLRGWIDQLGIEETEAFARSNNEPAPIAFRVVHTRASEKDIVDELLNGGSNVTASDVAPRAWRVSRNMRLVVQLAAQGKIYLQDEASQLVPEVLGATQGDRVLDLCAAPGSKTTQIADLLRDNAVVVASDLYDHRLKTVAESAATQGLKSLRYLVLDGVQSLPCRERAFDRVLVDAPCSGTGTLRRNPEIRWRISPADITDLRSRQMQLLKNAADVVKPGGRLVYSTCSVERAENEEVRQQFLENRKDFSALKLDVRADLSESHTVARTWPHRQGTDGFFICAFERTV